MVYAGSAARIHQPEPRKAGPHGRGSKDITLPQVERYYNQPLAQAARGLGLSATMLKKVCRSLGVRNWPYRQLASI
ncbi:RWP-RK domain-containing protein, partial [Tribonema minus]